MNQSEAREILGDDPHKTYRQLSKRCHPDTGGNANDFHKLREAYEALTKEDTTAEHDLLAQLFLQELDIQKVFLLLDQMEVDCNKTLATLPRKKERLQQARPKAKGFLVTILESAIHNLEDEAKVARTGISEVKKARILLNDLYTT